MAAKSKISYPKAIIMCSEYARPEAEQISPMTKQAREELKTHGKAGA